MSDISHIVRDDRENGLFRVDRRAFTDTDVLEEERRNIFDRSWLYVGHESEIAEPGAYITRNVGGRPIIMNRDVNGKIRVFFNACPHRGNIVCRENSGVSRRFTCFYHAWSFNTEGRLIGVPDAESYSGAFRKEEMGLRQVPRVESYRGLVFLSFDPNIVDLPAYLGNAAEYIDMMLDSAGAESEIVPGAQSYSMRANWKLLIENSIDGYHFAATHYRYVREYLPDIGVDTKAYGNNLNGEGDIGLALDNGHALVENVLRPLPLEGKAGQEMAALRKRLANTYGEERAQRIAGFNRNLFIFPNLILISMWRTVRTFYPVSPDYLEVEAWPLMPKGESLEVRQKRLENFISFLGPAGFGTPDDVSALEGCQRGFAARSEQTWSDLSRGMSKEQPSTIDELQMRAFWRRWQALVAGEFGPTDCSDGVKLGEATA